MSEICSSLPSTKLLIIVNRICNEIVSFNPPVTRRKVSLPNDLWWRIGSTAPARALCLQQMVVCHGLRFIFNKQEIHIIVFLLLLQPIPSQRAGVVVHDDKVKLSAAWPVNWRCASSRNQSNYLSNLNYNNQMSKEHAATDTPPAWLLFCNSRAKKIGDINS